MKILNSSFSLVFPPFFNVREQIFELERGLSEHFVSPFTLVPVPNEAPPEIPRITASTRNGHSNLAITLNSVQFNTNFDDNFSGNLEKCLEYIRSYSERIFSTLHPRLFSIVQFCGLIVNVQHQVPSPQEATSLVATNFSKLITESALHDALIKYTFTKANKYYINLQVQNQRLPQNQFVPGYLAQTERRDLLLISLDVNDRFALNYQAGYLSNRETMIEVINLTAEYLRTGIPDLIENGRFDV